MTRDSELWSCGCRQRPRRKSLRSSASPLPPPIAPSPQSLQLGRTAQGPGRALPGAAAGLHPHRAAGASLPLQPGVPVPLRHERRLPRPPLWPRAMEPPADLTTGSARAPGAHASCAAFPPAPARMELPGLHQARGSGRWKGAWRGSTTPTQFPAAKGGESRAWRSNRRLPSV